LTIEAAERLEGMALAREFGDFLHPSTNFVLHAGNVCPRYSVPPVPAQQSGMARADLATASGFDHSGEQWRTDDCHH
jgi:hypothetical protein